MGSETRIGDVAQAAGVSIRTVSRVLNKSPKVNAATRAKIEQAIAELNFRPSARARALALRRSFLIGLIHNDRNALVLDAIQRGVSALAAANGYEVIVHSTPLEAAEAIRDVLDFVERSRVDGLVVLPPVSGVTGLGAALAAQPIRAVALSSVGLEGFSEVLINAEREAGADVARYLLELGHRDLGLVNGPADTASATERRAGFLAEAARAGAKVREAPGDYDFASGVAAAEHLLGTGARPSAIFAANDIMAAGVLKVAAARRIAVPGDLSVIGFDGSLLTRMLSPSLTSVLRPFGEMAALAAERLIARIEERAPPERRLPTMRIVPAESTGPAPVA
ncbi:LacI family DNA-binding transcriptional regulator [Novosphingobium profundi]|uniref:LacI family DNA-binding transcriptional regulator n=1 Tax=Novosphingobium profundi TaxID=1774954 RepID=UPI001FEB15B5|nr:LacI family DNA-binding transcriptional regulator [Novosphingobium profundi]